MGPRLVQLSFLLAGFGACGGLLALSLPRWREYRAGGTAAPVSTPLHAPGQAVGVVPATSSGTAQAASRTAHLRLVAVRGSCWIVIRSGSATGTIRYAGNLEQGGSVSAAGARLWVTLGAAGNLDATLDGRRVQPFPTGTTDVVVTPAGVSQAPAAASTPVAGADAA